MMSRRTTLMAMAGAGLAAALSRALHAEQAPQTAARQAAAPDAALQEDLAQLGLHEYSDEGIPVFLACVNLAAEQAGKPVAAPTAMSTQIARDLRRYGDAWLHMHPDAPATDISKIIEVLANRDFKSGATGAGV